MMNYSQNSIDKPETKKKMVKSRKTVGPIHEGEKYEMLEIKGDRYTIDVGGVKLSYPLDYFYYIG